MYLVITAGSFGNQLMRINKSINQSINHVHHPAERRLPPTLRLTQQQELAASTEMQPITVTEPSPLEQRLVQHTMVGYLTSRFAREDAAASFAAASFVLVREGWCQAEE